MVKQKLGIEQRQHFRIKYPRSFRPDLIIDGKRHKVVDVSAAGLKYENTNPYNPEVGTVFLATLGFKTGGVISVRGYVVRTQEKFVMVRLDKGIPHQVLKAEADQLLAAIGEVPTDVY